MWHIWHSSHMINSVIVIATGGTIASTADKHGARVPTLSGAELVRRCGADARAVDAASLDSSSITLAQVDALAALVEQLLTDASTTGLVLTHGTDSLAETAMALDLVHADPRPLVLTGAQLPADHPGADGPGNLKGAIEAAADPANRHRGVMVYFAGRLLPARGLYKASTERLDAFDTVFGTASGTASGATPDAAPDTAGGPPRPAPLARSALAGINVPILRAWPGAGGELVDHVVDAMRPDGLVVEALGSGNVSEEMGKALGRAAAAGIPVVISTSVPAGGVSFDYGGAGGGATLGGLGAIPAGRLSPGQARMALLTALATGADPSSLL